MRLGEGEEQAHLAAADDLQLLLRQHVRVDVNGGDANSGGHSGGHRRTIARQHDRLHAQALQRRYCRLGVRPDVVGQLYATCKPAAHQNPAHRVLLLRGQLGRARRRGAALLHQAVVAHVNLVLAVHDARGAHALQVKHRRHLVMQPRPSDRYTLALARAHQQEQNCGRPGLSAFRVYGF